MYLWDPINWAPRNQQQAFTGPARLPSPSGRWFMGDMLNSDLGAMELVMNTNFWGTLRVLRAALPLLPMQGALAGIHGGARVLGCWAGG